MKKEMTESTKSVLDLAEEIANNFGCLYLGTEHILLAMVQDSQNTACTVLTEL